jgi:cytidylate kinase
MFQVITISREFGSGGGIVGRILSERLSWKLLDASMIDEIARAADIDPALAERFDETTDPWFRRVVKALWQGGYEGVASSGTGPRLADADLVAAEWRRVILESARIGHCVIIGHGGQCLLQDREDTFHVSVYAPIKERVARIRQRRPAERDPYALVQQMDHKRSVYIRRHFERDWTDRHLYNLMICSSIGLEAACNCILCAMGLSEHSSQAESKSLLTT